MFSMQLVSKKPSRRERLQEELEREREKKRRLEWYLNEVMNERKALMDPALGEGSLKKRKDFVSERHFESWEREDLDSKAGQVVNPKAILSQTDLNLDALCTQQPSRGGGGSNKRQKIDHAPPSDDYDEDEDECFVPVVAACNNKANACATPSRSSSNSALPGFGQKLCNPFATMSTGPLFDTTSLHKTLGCAESAKSLPAPIIARAPYSFSLGRSDAVLVDDKLTVDPESECESDFLGGDDADMENLEDFTLWLDEVFEDLAGSAPLSCSSPTSSPYSSPVSSPALSSVSSGSPFPFHVSSALLHY